MLHDLFQAFFRETKMLRLFFHQAPLFFHSESKPQPLDETLIRHHNDHRNKKSKNRHSFEKKTAQRQKKIKSATTSFLMAIVSPIDL